MGVLVFKHSIQARQYCLFVYCNKGLTDLKPQQADTFFTFTNDRSLVRKITRGNYLKQFKTWQRKDRMHKSQNQTAELKKRNAHPLNFKCDQYLAKTNDYLKI